MIKLVNNIRNEYINALQKGSNIGKKQLITPWHTSSGGCSVGQYFERKVLPNGNTKTRIATIYSGGSAIGLETKVVDPQNNIVYTSAGLIGRTSLRLRKKIKVLNKKVQENTATKRDLRHLQQMEKRNSIMTKMYFSGEISNTKRILYSRYKGLKTLIGKYIGEYHGK